MRIVDEDALKTKVTYADIAPEAKDAFFDMIDACRVSDEAPVVRRSMTNADYIRAMSDEDLAKFIYDLNDDDTGWVKAIDGDFIPCLYLNDIVKWLEQRKDGGK